MTNVVFTPDMGPKPLDVVFKATTYKENHPDAKVLLASGSLEKPAFVEIPDTRNIGLADVGMLARHVEIPLEPKYRRTNYLPYIPG